MTTQLLRFEVEGRKYRVMSKLFNNYNDVEFYVEQYLYDDRESGNQIWVKVGPDLINKNVLTIEQCTEILRNVSQYVNDYYLRY
jgi:hypothetical protein